VAASAGRRASAFAILGDMLELGPETAKAHEELGQEVARLGFAGLAAVGELAAHMAAGRARPGCPQPRARDAGSGAGRRHGGRMVQPGDWILVKASRGMRLERALDALERKLGT
jgi:UDP-N-acetylmuramoyl-tripeptide--D-alanyl-D-alanine ligase